MAKYPVDPDQYFNPDGEVWVTNIKDVCPKLCHFQQVKELAWDLDWKLLMACEWGDFESVVDMVNTDIPICETYKGCHLLIDFIPYPEMLEWVLERGACYYINTVPNFQPWPRAFSPPDHLCALSRLILRRDSGRLVLSRGSAEDKKREFISWKLKVVRILLKFGAALENPESIVQPLDAALNLVQDRNTESEGYQILQLMTTSFGAVADDHHVTRA
ncbi:hypothetical protein F5X68DRAFT_232602 [Plectosphaerella plurivora]|uniref:Uncharacterized protein n=1 Tax=Plectosphaerella plurivora TaxID=936078 RepID=A0A9P8VBU1_9PEZI|nr:hypothetical protein F5X68DRAFT_232602 [Plectosphaerella plurivora]